MDGTLTVILDPTDVIAMRQRRLETKMLLYMNFRKVWLQCHYLFYNYVVPKARVGFNNKNYLSKWFRDLKRIRMERKINDKNLVLVTCHEVWSKMKTNRKMQSSTYLLKISKYRLNVHKSEQLSKQFNNSRSKKEEKMQPYIKN